MSPSWFQTLSSPPPGRPLRLAGMAWPDIAALPPEDMVALLPVGAIEQHGPHLPIDTDLQIANAVCELASALTGAVVLPALPYGVSSGHTEKWPGTFSLGHATFIDAVCSLAAWLSATGWRRILIINGHCGNDASLRVAVDRIRTELPLLAATRNTWELSAEITRAFTEDAADWHANCAETSIMLVLDPAAVHRDRLGVADDPDRTAGCVFPHRVALTSLNGVTGRPSAATTAQGIQLLQSMGESLAGLIRRAATESPPLPWQPSFSTPEPNHPNTAPGNSTP